MKKQHLQEVRPEDFNIAALRRAAREGRLFVVPAPECETNIEQEVLAYVGRIAEYAAPPYRGCIDEVWRRIVNHPDLAPLMRSRKEGVNKYTVTALVVCLHEKGVYDTPTATALHLHLEGVTQRNKYYKGSANYAPCGAASHALREILRKFGIV